MNPPRRMRGAAFGAMLVLAVDAHAQHATDAKDAAASPTGADRRAPRQSAKGIAATAYGRSILTYYASYTLTQEARAGSAQIKQQVAPANN